jgi:hypothetical protein
MEECTEVISKVKLNKSLGKDGLTVEFYRTFWDSILLSITAVSLHAV